MNRLATKKCVPCQGGVQTLTLEQAKNMLADIPDWELTDYRAVTAISRRWQFDDFVQAQAFINRVGALAEAEGHHPDIEFGWGYARIITYTHKIGGLHENDFILAAKINAL